MGDNGSQPAHAHSWIHSHRAIWKEWFLFSMLSTNGLEQLLLPVTDQLLNDRSGGSALLQDYPLRIDVRGRREIKSDEPDDYHNVRSCQAKRALVSNSWWVPLLVHDGLDQEKSTQAMGFGWGIWADRSVAIQEQSSGEGEEGELHRVWQQKSVSDTLSGFGLAVILHGDSRVREGYHFQDQWWTLADFQRMGR